MKTLPLAGFKAYILGAILIAKGVAGMFFPEQNISDNPGADIQLGLMGIFLRAGIAKVK